jgi:hypothetical protein
VTEVHSPIAGSGDNCPSCGSPLAKDQRYCLHCGSRRGDPRLPFMDAVVFMDAVKQPKDAGQGAESAKPAAPDRRPLLSANASVVAGVATLVLAIGVGVLIGRSGDSGGSPAAAQPQIIRVGGSGGEGEAETVNTNGGRSGGKSGGGSSSSGKSTGGSGSKAKAKEKTQVGASGTSKATEEVFKPAKGVKLAEPEQKIGGKCEKGAAGCSESGTFDGSFFGE